MSEEQVCKEIIEQVGYQEFYRYFQEKTTLIEQQRQEIKRLENIIKEVREYITYARTPRTIYESGYGKGTCVEICMEHLLEILDKGEE